MLRSNEDIVGPLPVMGVAGMHAFSGTKVLIAAQNLGRRTSLVHSL